MPYPNFKNKHLEEALFSPQDYTKTLSDFEIKFKNVPKKYLLIYYPQILKRFLKKYKTKKISPYRLINIYQYKDVGVICMDGIGSPHAVTVLEELIGMGGNEFLNIGSAGGLQDFGTYLCKKSIRDEGTSSHYLKHQKFAYPNKELTNILAEQMQNNNISFKKGTSWTIDAPYRETKREIQKYTKEGVATVEMESSALFAVAQVRKVKIASAFVVSDVLSEHKWDPQFDKKHVLQGHYNLFDCALECLIKN